MTQVVIEPEVTQVLVEGAGTAVSIDAGSTILNIQFETTNLQIVVGEGVELLDVDPVSVSLSVDQIDVSIFSDIYPGTGGGGGGGTSFLPPPENSEETSGAFYMGWESVSGGWLVRRRDRVTFTTGDATVSNNGTYADLTAAWPDRATLTYA